MITVAHRELLTVKHDPIAGLTRMQMIEGFVNLTWKQGITALIVSAINPAPTLICLPIDYGTTSGI